MPAKTRSAEGRLLESLADHVRMQHPDMHEDRVMREARKIYEGPPLRDPLGPVGRRMRELRQRRIMDDKAHP